MKIIVYTKSNCPNCTTAKRLLSFKKLEFEQIDVETAEGLMSLNANVSGQYRQMPQIFIDGQRVGGLAGLQAALHQLGK